MNIERKLIEKQKELVEWLNQECPSVAPPLEPYTNYDLTHTFCDSLRLRLDKIASIKFELAKEQEPEWVTAEDYLTTDHDKLKSEIIEYLRDKYYPIARSRAEALKLIIDFVYSYAKSKQINLREELIKFAEWFNKAIDPRIYPTISIDKKYGDITEYLNQKGK